MLGITLDTALTPEPRRDTKKLVATNTADENRLVGTLGPPTIKYNSGILADPQNVELPSREATIAGLAAWRVGGTEFGSMARHGGQ